jgi:hypothetical protein
MSQVRKRYKTNREGLVLLEPRVNQWRHQWTYKGAVLSVEMKKKTYNKLPIDGEGRFLWNTGFSLPDYALSHDRRPKILILTVMRISDVIPVLGFCVQ